MGVRQLFRRSSLATHFSRTESFPSTLVSRRAFKQHQNMWTICSQRGTGQVWKIRKLSSVEMEKTNTCPFSAKSRRRSRGVRTKNFWVFTTKLCLISFLLPSLIGTQKLRSHRIEWVEDFLSTLFKTVNTVLAPVPSFIPFTPTLKEPFSSSMSQLLLRNLAAPTSDLCSELPGNTNKS